MGPRSVERGNDGRPGGRDPPLVASMGPRSVERGNMHSVIDPEGAEVSFNGATLGRAWKPSVAA